MSVSSDLAIDAFCLTDRRETSARRSYNCFGLAQYEYAPRGQNLCNAVENPFLFRTGEVDQRVAAQHQIAGDVLFDTGDVTADKRDHLADFMTQTLSAIVRSEKTIPEFPGNTLKATFVVDRLMCFIKRAGI